MKSAKLIYDLAQVEDWTPEGAGIVEVAGSRITVTWVY